MTTQKGKRRVTSSSQEERRCDETPAHTIDVQLVTDGISRRVKDEYVYSPIAEDMIYKHIQIPKAQV